MATSTYCYVLGTQNLKKSMSELHGPLGNEERMEIFIYSGFSWQLQAWEKKSIS